MSAPVKRPSFAGETWTADGGREVKTPDGTFYLAYGRDEKTSAPHYRDFCKLDEIARAMPLLPAAPDLLAALQCLIVEIEYLTEDGTLDKADVDSNASMVAARAVLAKHGGR